VRLKDRLTLVTGAASGIGRALAPRLGREGARLILLDRDADRLQTLADELAGEQIVCTTAAVDVTDRAAVAEAVDAAADELGPVDLLVACAGLTGVTLVDDLEIDRLEALARVNFLGVAYSIDAVLPGMLKRGQGQIAAIASMAAFRGIAFSGAYSASKAALMNYLESLRPALRRRGIPVSIICPGFVATPLMEHSRLRPTTRMMTPEKAADYILRAVLARKRFYCFPWLFGFGMRYLKWLPASVFDFYMTQWAKTIPNLKY
jgi:short-subunit dehydrogenase